LSVPPSADGRRTFVARLSDTRGPHLTAFQHRTTALGDGAGEDPQAIAAGALRAAHETADERHQGGLRMAGIGHLCHINRKGGVTRPFCFALVTL
jgi:hypothetical protein